MSDLSKRSIKLAYEKPEYREKLLPVINRSLETRGGSLAKEAALGRVVGGIAKAVGKAALPLVKSTMKATVKGSKSLAKGVSKGLSKGLGKGVKGVKKSIGKLKGKVNKVRTKARQNRFKKLEKKKLKPKKPSIKDKAKEKLKEKGKKIKEKAKEKAKELPEKAKDLAVDTAVGIGTDFAMQKGQEALEKATRGQQGPDPSQIAERAQNEFDAYKKKYPGTELTVQDFAEDIVEEYKKKAYVLKKGAEEDPNLEEEDPEDLEDLGFTLEEVVEEINSMSFDEIRPIANAISKIDLNEIEDDVALEHVLFLQKEISKRIKKHMDEVSKK